MKKLILIFCALWSLSASAQTWYIKFISTDDAAGTKDTIWCKSGFEDSLFKKNGQAYVFYQKEPIKQFFPSGRIQGSTAGPVAWADVTGKPSTFTPSSHSHTEAEVTNLTSDLAGKASTSHTHTFASNTSIPTTISGYGITDAKGYSINVQALTSSPADGATIYFGMLPKAPTTSAAISKVYIRKAGTIKIAEIYCYSGTAGTNESWSIYIRLNNSSETLIATVALGTSERIFSNTSLNIAVAAGDYIEIKSVNPTWATNPLTTIFGGYIYIE